MDVTFTNVLEGARQYFQGLPAASGSAASPSSTVSYGSAGHSSSGTVVTGDHVALVQQQQQQQQPQQPQPQATPPTSRPPSQQQYHYPTHNYSQYPTSHETVLQYSYPARSSSTSYHQLQPPRHHTPSTSYPYQQPQTQQQQPQPQQPAKPYYPPSVPQSQAYTIPVSTQTQTQQSYHGHQFTPHSYSPHMYQSTSKTPEHHRTTHNLPPIAALSSVNYHSNKSNREPVRLSSHRQTNHTRSQTATSATATVSISSAVSAPPSTGQAQSPRIPMQYPQNYETNTLHNPSSQSSTNGPTPYPSYPPASSQAYTCTTTTTPSFPSTTSSTVSAYSQSSYPQHFQKMRTQEQKQPLYQSSSKDYHYQSSANTNRTDPPPPSSVAVTNHARNDTHPATSVLTLKHKRESPLDLSVKTVRTSADSTALDDAEVHSSDQRINKGYIPNRSMPPPMQVPSSMPYSHDHNQRSSSIRSASASTGGAPKVDFLPNFNASSLHHGQQRSHADNTRQVIQQNDKNHNVNHASRNMTYSTKVYYQHQQNQQHHQQSQQQHQVQQQQHQVQQQQHQNNQQQQQHQNQLQQHQNQHQQQHPNHQLQNQQQQQQQQQSSYHHPSSYPHYNNNVMSNPAYNTPQLPQKRSDQILPRIDFPTPGHNAKTSTVYATSARDVHRKRPAESVPAVPNKIPKMDTWRQTIDQQIEQRLNSYANSKKHLEQQSQLQYPQPTSQQQHVIPHPAKSVNNVAKSVVNGNMMSNHHRSREMYATYTQNHASYPQTQQQYNNNQYHQQAHNQTYVPTAMSQHHYPPHANLPNHPQQDIYQQSVLQRTNSNPKLVPTSPVRNNNLGGADKRVLSILRNSLEIKGAKEAQKKLEQVQVKPQEIHTNHMRSSGVQQPTTDVTAPLQPKHGIVGRQNVSPFPAANLQERNSNTPPIYKFHFPRAVDSVRFETETITKENPVQTADKFTIKQDLYTDENIQNNSGILPTASNSNPSDLDGLAAFLAARIRTKAELKQVGTNQIQNISSNTTTESANNNMPPAPIYTNIANIPKLIKDRAVLPPRRRLFSRSDEEPNTAVTAPSSSAGSCAPARDSALRSSSETSVFDFRDSDSEGELSVLERQSLDDMRRDRKSMIKPSLVTMPIEAEKLEQNVVEIKIEEDLDPFWSETCDKFLEQLKTSGGKKRGRRKKVEADVIAKLETVTKENPIDNINLDAVVKLENIDHLQSQESTSSSIKIKTEVEEEPTVKVENDSDSDVPLVRRKLIKEETTPSDGEDSNLETRREKIGAKVNKIEYSSDSSDSDSETIQSVSNKLRLKKMKDKKENNKQDDGNKAMVLRSADSTPKKVNSLTKKKAIFGDGSDFHPGWEDEVYKYKRSLRMPARLINISRAPHWHRISTSLPDLDPCSPTASSFTDDIEFSMNISRRSMPSSFVEDSNKVKRELLDSDMDSNSSFTFNYQKAYDSEEASCSSLRSSSIKKEDKSKNKENNNILDVLVERYSKFKRKKLKGKDQKPGPKIIPKSTNPLELLPTPSLGIGTPEKEAPKPRGRPRLNKDKEPDKEENKTDVNNSVYLGFFRKETVNNFRDTFKKNSGFMGMGEPFSTVVLKSRTRTETRVMKQRATIREVFGEERPASAPPIACREDDNLDSSQDSIILAKKPASKPQIQATVKTKHKENNISPTRQGLRSASGRRPTKILVTKKQRGRKPNNLLKSLTAKKIAEDISPIKSEISPIKSETPSIKSGTPSIKSETPSIKSETPSIKSETPSVDGDEPSEASAIPTKKRLKLRNMRRKFSSGFDYIRKKKKVVKKEGADADGTVKTKRRGIFPRPSPESVQDIQREIKTWVMNKGVGETHLHRAARLGYTDVTAYCLEKMDCIPSPKDNAGYTPLHEACSRGHLDIARLLLKYGANVSDSAQGGVRPLHEAAENGFVEIVRLLLSYGGDPVLATYSGYTPLSLANDERMRSLLKHYMADMKGLSAPPWSFNGPAACFDPENSGYDPLSGAPSPDPIPEDEDIEIEMSEQQLPNLYVLRGEPSGDRWILLQDLSAILKIKSRDALLRQINGGGASSSSAAVNKTILRELKFADFMEQARCCTLLCANEKLNARSTKIALVKYTDKVKQLLGVERVVVTSR